MMSSTSHFLNKNAGAEVCYHTTKKALDMKQAFKVFSEDHSTSSERGGAPTAGVSSHRLPTRSTGTSQKIALFIGGLAFNITEREIQDYFEQFAPVIKLVLLRDRNTNISKGYAFVTIEGKDAAELILNQKNYILGRRVEIQQASKKNEKNFVDEKRKRKRLFVSHVPPNISNSEFEAFFSQFGEIHNCYIIQNYDGQTNKPYGFVEFRTEEQAMGILYRKKELVLRGNKLSIQQFRSKEESEGSNLPTPRELLKPKHLVNLVSNNRSKRARNQESLGFQEPRDDQFDENYLGLCEESHWRPLRELQQSQADRCARRHVLSGSQAHKSSACDAANLRFNVFSAEGLKHIQHQYY